VPIGERNFRLIVGLGNPGTKYSGNRHNIGFMVLDKLASGNKWIVNKEKTLVCETQVGSVRTMLLKPQTFMNLSGKAVAPVCNRKGIDPYEIIVFHDDLDLAAGRVRIKIGGGDGGHKGIRSIADSLRFKDFIRIRLGIGRPPANIEPEKFVLMDFSREESELRQHLIETGCIALNLILEHSVEYAQNTIHSNKGTPATD
jgi:PTH1 family peptidyl-tRNA hydrolase